MIFIFLLLIYVPFFNQSDAAMSLGKTCLNEDGTRELDFQFRTGVQEFDELNKQVVLIIDVYARDEDKQSEPFDVHLRRYPYLGSTVINVIASGTETYETDNNARFTESRITPILNFPVNLWPFETYKIPMFLEFDRDVKLCYDTFDDGSSDVSAYKAGYFPENPNWQVQIIPHETSFAEIEELVPKIKPFFENSAVFEFDTVISHTDNYKNKIVAYFFLAFAPMILMIGHLFWVRFEKLVSHITFFAAVSILILSSIVAMIDLAPIDLTLFEIVSISSVVIYAVGFFIFLVKRHYNNFSKKAKERIAEEREKLRIKSLPYESDYE